MSAEHMQPAGYMYSVTWIYSLRGSVYSFEPQHHAHGLLKSAPTPGKIELSLHP